MREALACLNAGDARRYYALLTDDAIRREVARFGPPPPAFLDRLDAPPTPLAKNSRIVLLAATDVRALADGRVGALVVQNDPLDPRSEERIVTILARIGDRWLIDEIGRSAG